MPHAHPVRIENGVPTPAADVLYTEGDCWILAFELGVQLCAPVVALGTDPFPDCWDHVMVDLGDQLLDVRGLCTREVAAAEWRATVFTELGFFTSWEAYCSALHTAPGVDDRDARTARRIASELVEQLGLTTIREKVNA